MAEYKEQLRKIQGFAKRIHLDFMDGHFASPASPKLSEIFWQPGPIVDLHLMFKRPMDYIEEVAKLQPHLVIVHLEAEDVLEFLHELDGLGIKRGIALLPETPPTLLDPFIELINHVLIFSGHLGHFGGKVDLNLLHKVTTIKKLKPSLEIGWDGGINIGNVKDLVAGGIDVLNTGGSIQKAEDPEDAYDKLVAAVEEE